MVSRGVSLFFILYISIALARDFKHDQGVIILENDNFEDAVFEFKHLLVQFYDPTSRLCKELAPEYAKAAKILADKKFEIKIAKVDATVEKELKKRFDVRAYPAFIFFSNGKSRNRLKIIWKAEDIVSWLINLSTIQLKYVETAKTLLEACDVVVIGFFKNQDSEDAKTFLEVAESFIDFPFGITSSSDVYKELQVDENENRVVLFKHFDELRNDFQGEMTHRALLQFVSVSRLPSVVEYTKEKSQILFKGHIKTHMLLFLNMSVDQTEILEVYRVVAEEFRGKMFFIYVDCADYGIVRSMGFFGLQTNDCPAIRLLELSRDLKKYKPESQDLDVKTIKSFAQKFFDGKLEPFVMTETLPDNWDEFPVKLLVGQNFKKVALDKTKIVLVQFYAPWCKHSQTFAPIYRELGKKYEGRDDIVIAEMNIVANEAENISVSRIPAIKLFPKGTNSFIDYKGERTLAGLSQFVDSEGEDATGVHEDEIKGTTDYTTDHTKEEL